MNQRNVKIVGIMLCVLVLGTLVPAVGAISQNVPQGDQSTMYAFAMVMGRVTNVHKIGKIVLAHATRLHYMGMSIVNNLKMGTVHGHEVMFRDTPRFHMLHMGMNTMVFGRVLRLRIF